MYFFNKITIYYINFLFFIFNFLRPEHCIAYIVEKVWPSVNERKINTDSPDDMNWVIKIKKCKNIMNIIKN